MISSPWPASRRATTCSRWGAGRARRPARWRGAGAGSRASNSAPNSPRPLPWTFFSNALTNSGNSLVCSSNLITKVYFPRMIIPGAAVGAGLVDFAIAFALLAGLMAYYHVVVTWSILMLPVLVALTTLLALGVGMWMSALNVKYRDIRYALPFLIQLWMFASPIIYPASIVPERWRWALALNPLTGIIEGFRSALFGRAFDWAALSLAATLTVAILTYAAYDFRRMEKTFADVV